MKRYTATAKDGTVYKRNSAADRIYTNAVVIYIPAFPAGENWRARDACIRVEWAGSRALAEKNARSWKYPTEIIEAKEKA